MTAADARRGTPGDRPLSWDLVRAFLVLAEELHVGVAAQRLGVSPRTLSRRITDLERVLGTPLAVRSTRRLTLTPAGEVLRSHAERIDREVARAVGAVRSEGRDQRLSMGVASDLDDTWAALVEEWVMTRGTSVALDRRAPDDGVRLLREGRLDLMLVVGEIHGDPRSAIVGHEPTVVVFPDSHPAAVGGTIQVGDLRDLRVAVSDAGTLEQHRRAVESLQGDPDLPYVLAPRLGRIAPGLVHAARAQQAAAIVLRRSVEQLDTTGLAVLPMQPPLTLPVILLGNPAAPEEPFTSLSNHLLGGS